MKTRNRTIRLRIRYKRRFDLVTLAALLALAVATVTFLGYLAWGQAKAAASGSTLATLAAAAPAAYAPMRKYYLTQSKVTGSGALTACAPGYHMASLWEILDPSNLAYDTDLGFSRADSGAGPPTGSDGDGQGWVRTGWRTGPCGGGAILGVGELNCEAWTTDSALGTVTWLDPTWNNTFWDITVWEAELDICGGDHRVWCVEDYPTFVYLPLVVKD